MKKLPPPVLAGIDHTTDSFFSSYVVNYPDSFKINDPGKESQFLFEVPYQRSIICRSDGDNINHSDAAFDTTLRMQLKNDAVCELLELAAALRNNPVVHPYGDMWQSLDLVTPLLIEETLVRNKTAVVVATNEIIGMVTTIGSALLKRSQFADSLAFYNSGAKDEDKLSRELIIISDPVTARMVNGQVGLNLIKSSFDVRLRDKIVILLSAQYAHEAIDHSKKTTPFCFGYLLQSDTEVIQSHDRITYTPRFRYIINVPVMGIISLSA